MRWPSRSASCPRSSPTSSVRRSWRPQPGRAGGYRLAKPAASISLLDVIEAVEGDSRRRTCVLRGGPCGVDGHCDVHDAFFRGQAAMLSALQETSLASLAAPATSAALRSEDDAAR